MDNVSTGQLFFLDSDKKFKHYLLYFDYTESS